MTDRFDRGDALEPVELVHVREPSAGLRAALVIDNMARGPGGWRAAHGAGRERRRVHAPRARHDAEELRRWPRAQGAASRFSGAIRACPATTKRG